MARRNRRVAAIVPAAGSGTRLGLRVKKPFVLLRGKPLVTYALAALEASKDIDAIFVAADKRSIQRLKGLVRRYRFKKIVKIVIGGKTRFESVGNCLKAFDSSFDIVLIHDGARPLLESSLIHKSISLAQRYGGCIAAVPEHDTVKAVDKNLFISKTLDRKRIWRAQTPQAFRYGILKKAYADMRNDSSITDDASLIERLGNKVRIVRGSYRNIKITTREDLKIAEVLL